MPTVRWDENKPAGGDSIGIGDDEIRSTKTALRTALDSEHVFPSAGGDAGVHRLGSARPYFGLQSAVSSTGSDGRLFQASDTSRLFGVGSGGTTFIGGPTVISAGSYPGSVPQRHYWATEFGETRITSSGGTIVGFPNSGFSGKPFVQLTASRQTSGSGAWAIAILDTVNATEMTVIAIDDTGAALSNCSVFWQSLGTRVL